jgi:hypothetical protein
MQGTSGAAVQRLRRPYFRKNIEYRNDGNTFGVVPFDLILKFGLAFAASPSYH